MIEFATSHLGFIAEQRTEDYAMSHPRGKKSINVNGKLCCVTRIRRLRSTVVRKAKAFLYAAPKGWLPFVIERKPKSWYTRKATTRF